MSADTLRRASTKLREVAEACLSAAGGEPWKADYTGSWTVDVPPDFQIADTLSEEVAEHIALWHPTVALAVADLLDATLVATEWDPNDCEVGDLVERSVAVARLILGESA